VTGTSDGLGNLVSGKLTTLTRLGTLGHLDLKLVGIGEVGRSDTESAGSDLLNGRAHSITVGHALRSLRILTTFTSVGLAAKAVHGNGEGRVRLHGNGTIRHGTSAESADNVSPRLDLINGDRSAVLKLEVQETTERARLDLLILGSGVGLVGLVILGADGILDVGNRGRIVNVRLTTITPVVLSRLWKTRHTNGVSRGKSTLVETVALLGNQLESQALDTGGSALKTSLDNSLVKTKGLENLGTLVRGKSGDTHLAHDLEDTTVARVLVVADKGFVRELLLDKALTVELKDALHGKVGVDGIGTIAKEDTHVVDFTGLSSLNNESSH
jgi:hypothetical protein